MPQSGPFGQTASTTLDAVIARTAIVFRCVFCVGAPVAAMANGPVPGSELVRALALAVVLAWGVVVWRVCRQQRRLPRWLVLVDVSLSVAFALGMGWLAPAHLVGDGSIWPVAGLSTAVLLASWALRPWAALVATMAAAASYVGGVAIAGAAVSGALWQPVVLIVQLGLGLVLVRYMRRTAAATDHALELLADDERRDRVAAKRSADEAQRRELLHDEVIATLTVVARGDPSARSRALHERARAAFDGLREQTRSDRSPVGDAEVATAQLATQVVEEARMRGITIRADVSDVLVPAQVGHAVLAALREGARNIERHASIKSAELVVRRTDDAVAITLTDRGVGVGGPHGRRGRRRAVGAHTFGIRSIAERMAAVGGSGEVTAAGGGGTRVTLIWPADERDRRSEPPGVGRDPFGSFMSDAYATGMARALSLVPVIWHPITIGPLLMSLGESRSPLVSVGGWLTLTAVAVLLAVRRARPLGPRASAAVLLVSVAASAVSVAMVRGDGLIGLANWPLGDVGWFVVALTAQRHPRWVLALWPVTPAVTAVAAGLTIEDPIPALGHLVNIVMFVGYLQAGAFIVYRLLRSHGTTATRALRRAHEIETAQAAREAVAADRAARYRILEPSLAPLLRGLADGTLDPDEPRVRREAWVRASMLRTFIEHDERGISTEAIDRVTALAAAAADRNLVVWMRVADLGRGPDDVADSLTAMMKAVIDQAEPGDVRLVVRADGTRARAAVHLSTTASVDQLYRVAAATSIPLKVEVVPLTEGTVRVEAQWIRP